jgi:non-specific serine/threonine protein kinase/serine/threonine-protein kinase
MGAVYEAEQDSPRRTVALKIIKPAKASPDLLRRFEQESQALGRLQHPGIAQIYEAGTLDLGFGPQPYFAMEFIRGLSPRNYAEAHHLNTRERLQIMAKICDGVHHAHQRGLIHRDLKPGNILVDESGQPKILDFGVARLTDSDARATQQTDVGQLVGTLAYMSPEQALADPLDIDTRTDVYALGVILYELLSGELPYPISKKIYETIQTIREQDPARLSAVNRACRGDIETIVAKALEKDRGRRYASAAEMAADIQRYLNDEPIVARPQSAGYHFQKFARRHRPLVLSIAAVFVVLVVGIVVVRHSEQVALQERDRALEATDRALEATGRALRAEQVASTERDGAFAAREQARRDRDTAVAQRDRADTLADTATELNDFLGKLLTLPDPRMGTELEVLVKANPNLTFREVLDRAAAGIDGKFTRPSVEAKLREFIGVSYRSIGLFAEAQSQFERAVELYRREHGRAHPDSVKALKALLEVARRGVFSGAYVEALQQEIVDIEIQTLGKKTQKH